MGLEHLDHTQDICIIIIIWMLASDNPFFQTELSLRFIIDLFAAQLPQDTTCPLISLLY